mgnify:CR=1 FL=1
MAYPYDVLIQHQATIPHLLDHLTKSNAVLKMYTEIDIVTGEVAWAEAASRRIWELVNG